MGIIPSGAAPILAARKQGKKPAELTLLSMMGELPNEANPVVQIKPSINYDWGWIRGLAACFWTTPDTYHAKHIIDAAKAMPGRLYLWDSANQTGYDIFVIPTLESIERPQAQWTWIVDPMPWLPFQNKAFALGEAICN